MIDRLIKREGGYVDDERDSGGETKWGISKRSYPHLDIRNLTIEQAREIYWDDYVRRFKIDQIRHPDVAENLLDWAVHSGSAGIKFLQREMGLQSDGVVGPKTLEKLNELRDGKFIMHSRLRFWGRLTKHPFIVGWINRLIGMGL